MALRKDVTRSQSNQKRVEPLDRFVGRPAGVSRVASGLKIVVSWPRTLASFEGTDVIGRIGDSL